MNRLFDQKASEMNLTVIIYQFLDEQYYVSQDASILSPNSIDINTERLRRSNTAHIIDE